MKWDTLREPKEKTPKAIIQQRMDALRELQIKRMVELQQAHNRLTKDLTAYHADDFPGRIVTNEIKIKKNSLRDVTTELESLQAELLNKKEVVS